VTEIWPASTIEEARSLHERMPDAVLGGERKGDPIEGFTIGNNPMEYVVLKGRRVITTTTNGTVALRACHHGDHVLVGALLNLEAIRREVEKAGSKQLLLVCAGTFETFALEDAIAAGLLADMFPNAELSDAAYSARATATHFSSPLEGLRAARNGRALVDRGWGEQVEWCAQLSRFEIVGAMSGGVIRPI
jgi:2-phosphosulfolactate phosphatase